MIGSLLKAIDIMELFSDENPRLSLAQIAARLSMPKSTAHNLLNTLRSRGYIEKMEGDQYALGRQIVALASSVCVNLELRDRAAPLLRELADACGDSVYLTVPDGHKCLYVYAVESSHRLNARTAMGVRAHMHCTGVGKAMLAYLPEERVNEIVGAAGLPGFTSRTITDRRRLDEELAAIRERGYSTDSGEHEEGNYCVGAPIFDDRGRLAGACSFAGPDPQIVGSKVGDLAACVTYTAREISRRLGYVMPRSLALALESGNPLERYRERRTDSAAAQR